jgi:protein N-lysine methyltransferase METTL21D
VPQHWLDAHTPRLTLAALGVDTLATDVPLVLPTLTSNINQNKGYLPLTAGALVICELDWTVPPEKWTWSGSHSIASLEVLPLANESIQDTPRPPFDLIITADTLYHDELVAPLLRTLHHLVSISSLPNRPSPKCFVALERRDPALIDRALASAREDWAFACERVPPRKLVKAMVRAGLQWAKEDWEGLEIWELSLSATKKKRHPIENRGPIRGEQGSPTHCMAESCYTAG